MWCKIANCTLMIPNGDRNTSCPLTIHRMLLLIVPKIYHVNKVFIDPFLCAGASPRWKLGGGGR